jgi:hypothetical protein
MKSIDSPVCRLTIILPFKAIATFATKVPSDSFAASRLLRENFQAAMKSGSDVTKQGLTWGIGDA